MYYLCKLSGVAGCTFAKNVGYTVTLRDKLQTIVTAMVTVLIGVMGLLSVIATEGLITLMGRAYRFINICHSLTCFVVMYRRNHHLVRKVEEIIEIDKQLRPNAPGYSEIRKIIIVTIVTYLTALLLMVLNDLNYCVFAAHCNACTWLYCISYYMFYIVNASVLTVLFFFLVALKERFTIIKLNVIGRNLQHIKRLINLDRRLRTMSNSVNEIFQPIILGRVVVIGMDIIYLIMGSIAYTDSVYIKIATTCVCSGHTFEIVGIIYCFSTLRKEVRKQIQPTSATKTIRISSNLVYLLGDDKRTYS